MNSATALAMFYASVQTMAEHQGRDATLQRLDLVRGWIERTQENNGQHDASGMRRGLASGEEIHCGA